MGAKGAEDDFEFFFSLENLLGLSFIKFIIYNTMMKHFVFSNWYIVPKRAAQEICVKTNLIYMFTQMKIITSWCHAASEGSLRAIFNYTQSNITCQKKWDGIVYIFKHQFIICV